MTSFANSSSYSFGEEQLYDYTTMPYTRTGTPDITTWWTCCACNREVNPSAHGTTCPDCGHSKCDSCKATEHETSPVQEQLNSDAPTHRHSHFQADDAGHHEHRQHQHAPPINYMSGPGYDYTRGPSMAGWWQCCQCSQQVNEAWYGTDCTACSHPKCDFCYNL